MKKSCGVIRKLDTATYQFKLLNLISYEVTVEIYVNEAIGIFHTHIYIYIYVILSIIQIIIIAIIKVGAFTQKKKRDTNDGRWG